MPEFGRGQSGGRENNYNYINTCSLNKVTMTNRCSALKYKIFFKDVKH